MIFNIGNSQIDIPIDSLEGESKTKAKDVIEEAIKTALNTGSATATVTQRNQIIDKYKLSIDKSKPLSEFGIGDAMKQVDSRITELTERNNQLSTDLAASSGNESDAVNSLKSEVASLKTKIVDLEKEKSDVVANAKREVATEAAKRDAFTDIFQESLALGLNLNKEDPRAKSMFMGSVREAVGMQIVEDDKGGYKPVFLDKITNSALTTKDGENFKPSDVAQLIKSIKPNDYIAPKGGLNSSGGGNQNPGATLNTEINYDEMSAKEAWQMAEELEGSE